MAWVHHDHEHEPHGDGGHGEPGVPTELASAGRGRQLEGAILLALGAYLGYLVASGDVGNYLNLRFAWLPLAGAALSMALGAHAILFRSRSRPGQVQLAGYHAGHVHAGQLRAAAAFVAVPLALGVLVPSRPLGAGAIGGDVTFNNVSAQGATVASADSLQWSVLDWLRAYSYGAPPERLNGKPADVLGFVYRREGDPPGHFILSRFLMVHCTADAYAVGIPVDWERADGLALDAWVRVQGTITVGSFHGNSLPILHAQTVDESVGRPAQVYLYQ